MLRPQCRPGAVRAGRPDVVRRAGTAPARQGHRAPAGGTGRLEVYLGAVAHRTMWDTGSIPADTNPHVRRGQSAPYGPVMRASPCYRGRPGSLYRRACSRRHLAAVLDDVRRRSAAGQSPGARPRPGPSVPTARGCASAAGHRAIPATAAPPWSTAAIGGEHAAALLSFPYQGMPGLRCCLQASCRPAWAPSADQASHGPATSAVQRLNHPGAPLIRTRTLSAICPCTAGNSRTHMDTAGPRRAVDNSPRDQENPAHGLFPQVVAGVGFEPT